MLTPASQTHEPRQQRRNQDTTGCRFPSLPVKTTSVTSAAGSPVRHRCGRRPRAPLPDWRSSDSSRARTSDGCSLAWASPFCDADVPSGEEERGKNHSDIKLNQRNKDSLCFSFENKNLKWWICKAKKKEEKEYTGKSIISKSGKILKCRIKADQVQLMPGQKTTCVTSLQSSQSPRGAVFVIEDKLHPSETFPWWEGVSCIFAFIFQKKKKKTEAGTRQYFQAETKHDRRYGGLRVPKCQQAIPKAAPLCSSYCAGKKKTKKNTRTRAHRMHQMAERAAAKSFSHSVVRGSSTGRTSVSGSRQQALAMMEDHWFFSVVKAAGLQFCCDATETM